MSELKQIADEIIHAYQEHGEYLRSSVHRLTALALGEGEHASNASRVIFGSLVEPVADSFEVWGVKLYNRVFSQIIELSRRQVPELDLELNRFGLRTEEDVFLRPESLGPASVSGTGDQTDGALPSHRDSNETLKIRPAPSDVSKVLILSRVTLGADVAITSILIERVSQAFPAAAITLIGGGKMKELFGGDPRVSFYTLEYGRRGLLSDRLSSWIELTAAVRSLTVGLKSDQYIVIDPDSRMTQLGLLPVCDPESYFLFPSRDYHADSDASIATLASTWSSEIFSGPPLLPKISIAPSDFQAGRDLVNRLRGSTAKRVACLNFGVGGNEGKRAGLAFEQGVINFLVSMDHKQAGCVVAILDRGTGERESELVDSILDKARERTVGISSVKVMDAREDNLDDLVKSDLSAAGLLVWRGRIGLLAGIINASDLYIGYDSMGQHLAAALGTPCIDVVAGYSSRKFLQRWTPTGPGPVKIVAFEHGQAQTMAIREVGRAAREFLS